jgi:streptogramin lyase
LVRLHGEERVQVVTGGQPEAGPISISPDGTVWFASSTAIYRILPDALP